MICTRVANRTIAHSGIDSGGSDSAVFRTVEIGAVMAVAVARGALLVLVAEDRGTVAKSLRERIASFSHDRTPFGRAHLAHNDQQTRWNLANARSKVYNI